jgi:hypothetical protein
MGDLLEWGFTEWDFSMGQFGGEEWLPEPVDNTDIEGAGAESFRAIVRFANSEERDEFFERVGVEVDGAYPVTLDFATLVWGG